MTVRMETVELKKPDINDVELQQPFTYRNISDHVNVVSKVLEERMKEIRFSEERSWANARHRYSRF